jgi:septum formation protein
LSCAGLFSVCKQAQNVYLCRLNFFIMPKDFLEMPYSLILGSASPRRQELLKIFDLPFEVRTQQSEENFPAEMPTEDVPLHIAEQKRDALLPNLKKNELLITVDTVVILKNEVIGKAGNKNDAFEMISKLSGNRHEVISGVCVYTHDKEVKFSEKTSVFFKELSEKEIHFYIEKYRPFDKAGAYGIQEWLGMTGIRRIEGCFYNVMGLPLSSLYDVLKNF